MHHLKGSARARYMAAAFAVSGGLGLAALGCGDDDSSTSADSSSAETSTTASAEDVTVTAIDYEFDLSATPTADTKSITFQNDGKEFHVMIFAKLNEGFTLDEAVKLEGKEGSAVDIASTQAEPGTSTTVEINKPIGPGHYVILCPLKTKDGEDHYKLGQLQEFDLE